jgi:hypothetical protein
LAGGQQLSHGTPPDDAAGSVIMTIGTPVRRITCAIVSTVMLARVWKGGRRS